MGAVCARWFRRRPSGRGSTISADGQQCQLHAGQSNCRRPQWHRVSFRPTREAFGPKHLDSYVQALAGRRNVREHDSVEQIGSLRPVTVVPLQDGSGLRLQRAIRVSTAWGKAREAHRCASARRCSRYVGRDRERSASGPSSGDRIACSRRTCAGSTHLPRVLPWVRAMKAISS